MGWKNQVKTIVEKATKTQILRDFPHGVNLFADIKRMLPKFGAELFLDVGANIGQSAEEMVRSFPQAKVFCFEPVKSTFATLSKNVQGLSGVRCFNTALGARTGEVEIIVNECSLLSSVAGMQNTDGAKKAEGVRQTIQMITLDEFCKQNSISKISLLKIDTEGADLDVLHGASELLGQQRVDIVQLEAGMNPSNKHHVSFEDLKHHMEAHSYFLFGLYEQVNEWPTRRPNLRRTDPVFISERVINANTFKT